MNTAEEYSAAWFRARWNRKKDEVAWNDSPQGANWSKQWTLNNFDYQRVHDSPNLPSIVETVEKGVAGPLKTANKGIVRPITQDWHYTSLDRPNPDKELHFNINMPKASAKQYDMMYHVYEDGRSKSMGYLTYPPVEQNSAGSFHRDHAIAHRPTPPKAPKTKK